MLTIQIKKIFTLVKKIKIKKSIGNLFIHPKFEI